MDQQTIDKLQTLNACSEFAIWAGTQPDLKTLWENCEKSDWMLWLVGKMSGEPHSQARKKLVGCTAECAAMAIQFVRDEECRVGLTEVADLLKRYSENEADTSANADMIRARELAWKIRKKVADDVAAVTVAYVAAAVAVSAAAAADNVAVAATATAGATGDYVASAVAVSADAAAAASTRAGAARKKLLKDLCEIVRRHYPQPPELA